jgi:hypothetical protein
VNAALAVIPHFSGSSRPDIAWIRKNVAILEVGKALGLRIRHRRAKCWRPENHAHGDANPSLHFFERGNRVRCFVCDMRGGHSNVDLVMGVLGVTVGEAVRWIAERFTVPNVKPGRPLGKREVQAVPYRVGVQGSEFELLVRSGMFGKLPAPERTILVALAHFRDPDSGLSQLSYTAIQRYAGVASRATVARALRRLARLHAIEIHPGLRIGITRKCSAYRVTLEDPKFLHLCNEVCRISREQVVQERNYRRELRAKRQETPRRQLAVNANATGGLCPPAPPVPYASIERQEKPTTCEGLNLSSINEPMSNRPVHSVNHETRISGQLSIEEQKQILRERSLL